MAGIFKKNKNFHDIQVPTIGKFRQLASAENEHWFCDLHLDFLDQGIELIIETTDSSEPTTEQLASIKSIPEQYESITCLLYQYLENAYSNEDFDLEKLKQMYYLSAITLKADNLNWWYVLEPKPNVSSRFDHFLRFTVANGEIIWSSISDFAI